MLDSLDGGYKQTLNSKQANVIQFLSSGETLVIGTAGGEFISRSPSDGELNKENKNAKRQSAWGSEFVRPVNMGRFV